MRTSIYIPLAPTGGLYGDNFELRYMLRSIATLWQGELPALTILGTRPDWVQGIACHEADTEEDAQTKAAALAGLRRFLWWYDDCFLLKRSTVANFEFPRAAGALLSLRQRLKAGGAWAQELLRVSEALEAAGKTQWDFSTPHAPYLCSGVDMREALDRWKGDRQKKFPIESWILNDGRIRMDADDVETRFTASSRHPNPKSRLLVVADGGLPLLRPWLEKRFTKPSPWERRT